MDDRGIRKARRLTRASSRLIALGIAAVLLVCLGSSCAPRPSAVAHAETGGHTEPDLVGPSGTSESAGPIPAKPPLAARGKGASAERETEGDLNWPLRGVLYARFGRRGREVHDGIDLAAPVGTPVKTAGPGRVVYAGEQKGYGLIAIIEHPNGLTTLYAHNHELRVKTGQQVRAGQQIASVGESGRTTGPHLHFEVRRDGVPVDPLPHLGPIPR